MLNHFLYFYVFFASLKGTRRFMGHCPMPQLPFTLMQKVTQNIKAIYIFESYYGICHPRNPSRAAHMPAQLVGGLHRPTPAKHLV
jgi:hypothetical protein